MSQLEFALATKRFGNVTALSSFSLSIKHGELITILGPSGCGKTTALRVAAGFEHLDEGRLIMKGQDISHVAPQKRNMGMVFQSYSLFPHLTVVQNIAFGLTVRKTDKKKIKTTVSDMLDLVRLIDIGDRYPHQLSGGQQQRVALARALAIEPSILLLDEPLSALDAKVRVEVRDEIRALQLRTGTTTLFVTHDQDEALAISDRVCVMSEGVIHQVDTPREVYERPSSNFVARFIGQSDTVNLNGQEMLFRPEDVRLVPDAEPASFRGIIRSIEFGGSTCTFQIVLTVNGTVVRSVCTNRDAHQWAVGQEVGVLFDHPLYVA
jgi:putative spermidine/putrescine transport system ATP-binding protein